LIQQGEPSAQGEPDRGSDPGDPLSPETSRQVLHDLRVHQVELEAQNQELRRTQQELEVARARYFDLYEMAPVGYFTFSEGGVIQEANLTAAELLGLPRGALVKEPLTRFILPEDQDVYYRHRKQLVETGARQVSEFRVLTTDGKPRWVRLEETAVEGGSGPLICRAAMSDITMRKRLEVLLSQQDRLASMGMLAAGVAHEINNPLASALYNVETLVEDLPKLARAVERCVRTLRAERGAGALATVAGDEARMLEFSVLNDLVERARDALDSTQRIKRISRAIGTFARVESNERSRVDLNYAIKCAVTMAQNDIKFRARLNVDFGTLPAVWASEGKLSQVFLNLLINAAQAFRDGDLEHNQIAIRTWVEGAGVFAEVKDNGDGIAQENIGRIFEPFFTTKPVGEGSGLGLAICRNIIGEFGGDIRVESELGRGTRFVVHLPIQSGASASPRGDAPPDIPGTSKVRGRILIVDDEQLVRSLLNRMLGRDHEVVTVASGEAARTILENDSSFDVILCDLMMPGMTGMDLHEWLVTHRPALAGRVVFVTGGAFTPQASDYVSRVGNARFEKPFRPGQLKSLISEMVAARRAH
jgi:PAS domain S-box-containing protein